MKIGIPRALGFYRYGVLWGKFFSELGEDVIISPQTNAHILQSALVNSVDESCLPAKLFNGHAEWLLQRCDKVLIPCIEDYGKHSLVCVKFNALYDIVRNTFTTTNTSSNTGNNASRCISNKLLDLHISKKRGKTQRSGLIGLAKALGHGTRKAQKAYAAAQAAQTDCDARQNQAAVKALNGGKKPALLIVAHPYILQDALLGVPATQLITRLGGACIPAYALERESSVKAYPQLSKSLYWQYNKELTGALALALPHVCGVVFLTAFPCGPDSLVNELLMRKIKTLPKINIVLDELTGLTGLETRIESFMDMVISKQAGCA